MVYHITVFDGRQSGIPCWAASLSVEPGRHLSDLHEIWAGFDRRVDWESPKGLHESGSCLSVWSLALGWNLLSCAFGKWDTSSASPSCLLQVRVPWQVRTSRRGLTDTDRLKWSFKLTGKSLWNTKKISVIKCKTSIDQKKKNYWKGSLF